MPLHGHGVGLDVTLVLVCCLNRLAGGRKDGVVAMWDAHAPNLGLVDLPSLKPDVFSFDSPPTKPSRKAGDLGTSRASSIPDAAPSPPVKAAAGAAIRSLAWLVDGQRLITGAEDGSVVVWRRSGDDEAGAGGHVRFEQVSQGGSSDSCFSAAVSYPLIVD